MVPARTQSTPSGTTKSWLGSAMWGRGRGRTPFTPLLVQRAARREGQLELAIAFPQQLPCERLTDQGGGDSAAEPLSPGHVTALPAVPGPCL